MRSTARFCVLAPLFVFAGAAHAQGGGAPPPASPPATPSAAEGPDDATGATADDEGEAGEAAARAGLADLPPAALEKLSPDQVIEVLRLREEARTERLKRSSPPAVATVVPLGFFLCLLLIVVAILFFRLRAKRELHETLRRMVEKGADIPAELLHPPASKHADLKKGVLWTGTGASVALALVFLDGLEGGAWSLGLIPLFIGAGYLIVYRLTASERTGQS